MSTTVSVVDSGNTTNTVITVALPGTYDAGDEFVVIWSRNNAESYPTFGSNVTATLIQSNGGRLAAYRIVPDTLSEVNFTITGSNSIWSWALLEFTGDSDLSEVIASNVNNGGSSTTALIEFSTVDLGYVATGNEVVISAGGVNATASWTTSGATIFNTTGGNAALMVNKTATTAGEITVVPANFDRGLGGTPRSESSLSFVVQAVPIGKNNLLSNASFELGVTIATDWVDESNVTGTPTYSLSTTTGVEDGLKAQRVQYTGVAGDDGTKKVQFYALAYDGFSPGDTVQFDLYITGTMTNAYGIFGAEAFEADGTYISDVAEAYNDADIDPTTPTKLSMQYTVPPLGSYLAVFIQFPAFALTGVIDVYFDKAVMTNLGVLSSPARRLFIMTM